MPLLTRDELGETRPGLAPGLLVTDDFETADRALWAMFDLVQKAQDIAKPHSVLKTMERARTSHNLFVKRFFILVGLCMFQEMRDYYQQTCPPKFTKWVEGLSKEFAILFFGKNDTGKEIKDRYDAKYPNIEIFVAKNVGDYLQM